MADRRTPEHKNPKAILDDVLAGHEQAMLSGYAQAQKYLESFLSRNNSTPNAVKFFVYDLLCEASYQNNDGEKCRQSVELAWGYLGDAQEEAERSYAVYKEKIRFFERGISLNVDEGCFDQALKFCDGALALGLGNFYQAKKSSIQRMM